MYLRTTARKNADGTAIVYYQLAHNRWNADSQRSTVEVIHNFGRADDLDRDALVRLCASIARVCNVEVRDREATAVAEEDPVPAGVEMHRARDLGSVVAVRTLWERLGIGPTLRAIGRKEGRGDDDERALFAMVLNRLCVPTSKLGVWDRWLDTVHVPECDQLALARMYEAMDLLEDHHEEVEKSVFFETANLLNLDVDVILYDTTTAEFAIEGEDDDIGEHVGLRKRGYSKDSRWTPQVVVALAVTREGFPVRSWVFPGNTTDVTTIRKIRQDLRGWKLARTLFVGDAGMNSEENRAELARACGHYVLASRTSGVSEVEHEVLGRPGRYKVVADNLHVKEVVVGDGEKRRRYVVCRNPKEAERQRRHREEAIAQLEAELTKHPNHSATARWAAQLRASGRYGSYLRVVDGKLVIDRDKVANAERFDGKWVLATNDDTLSTEEVATTYKGLLVIERCFRTLKSAQIRIRPMFHRLEHRIAAHVRLCVLALLITRVAETACAATWPRLHDTLSSLLAVEFRSGGQRIFRRSEPTAEVLQTLKLLNVELPKTIIGVMPVLDDSTAT